jgi:ATP/maltotriose-dependent transcriptional regulator MalT
MERCMPSILARLIGITDITTATMDEAVTLVSCCTDLSRREARVLLLDFVGRSSPEISEELKVSTSTITTYWHRIYNKIGVRGRKNARVWTRALLDQEIRGN